MVTLEPFSGGMLNLRRFVARSVTDENLNLEGNKTKKKYKYVGNFENLNFNVISKHLK